MSTDRRTLAARGLVLVERELQTVRRTRTFALLAAGFAAVVLGVAWTGGGVRGGYVPVALDLLAPMEVLVPVLAFAFGYRAVRGDADRGELDTLRTYPLSRASLVLGVYVGRAAALLVVVLGSLLLAGLVVPLAAGPSTDVIASHAGADSALLYLRFVALTAGFALVALAVAVTASAAARSGRQALVLAVGLLLALVVALDLAVVASLAGGLVPDGGLAWLVAASPNSAYRGLVLETVVGAVTAPETRAAVPALNVAGLLAWLVGALVVAAVSVWKE